WLILSVISINIIAATLEFLPEGHFSRIVNGVDASKIHEVSDKALLSQAEVQHGAGNGYMGERASLRSLLGGDIGTEAFYVARVTDRLAREGQPLISLLCRAGPKMKSLILTGSGSMFQIPG
ncbi:MAG: hypothetical protein Q8R48_06775, partial [Candidatus Omnitrophota bacterium]|nr:hypothetical protein [Candidatus Omnitrophota bacterium]